MKMFYYYIAEDFNKEDMGFANHLIKRCDTYEEAVEFCNSAVNKWREDGLVAELIFIDVNKTEVWGAHAYDKEFVVKHLYNIFATPMFMAGGVDGL